jgi:hypothetical protein
MLRLQFAPARLPPTACQVATVEPPHLAVGRLYPLDDAVAELPVGRSWPPVSEKLRCGSANNTTSSNVSSTAAPTQCWYAALVQRVVGAEKL